MSGCVAFPGGHRLTEPINDSVLLEIGDGIARVRMARVEARNAVNLAMCHGLATAFGQIAQSDEVRVVVISADGPVFCAGADLKERQGKDAAWVRQRRLAAFAAYEAISACAVPVVALVQGPVVGSGGEIALAADFTIAADDVRFRFPEPQWGTVGATQRLQRAVGRQRAKDMLFTGRWMTSHEALACGLVARVVPSADLVTVGLETAAAIAAAPPLAMRLTKQAMDLGAATDLATAIRIELAAIDRVLAAAEWTAGVEKFSDSIGGKSD